MAVSASRRLNNPATTLKSFSMFLDLGHGEIHDCSHGRDSRSVLDVPRRQNALEIQSIKPAAARGTDLAFPDEDSRQWFNECLETAKIEDYTWHNNRHTFGSWLAMAGASTKEIQESGGWKSIQMAARYSHLSPVHTASVVDRLI
jgi:integrase